MKNPFEFARKLIRYAREELSGPEREGVEVVLSEVEEVCQLARELKNNESTSKELRLMGAFDVEKALERVRGGGVSRGRSIAPWVAAASVIVLIGFSALFLLNRDGEEVPALTARQAEPGKATVVLELASGAKYRLDTLKTIIRNNKANVDFDNQNGVLRVEDQEAGTELSEEAGNNKITVPYGGTYTLELADGSKVYLNSGTVFEFPSRFDEGERRVEISGEAYFEVAKDRGKSFIVEVNEMTVKVLGTSFNVKSYRDEPGVWTTLEKGSVAVICNGQPERVIVPGEQAYYNKGMESVTVSAVDTEEYTAWKDGLFYFKDRTLEEILQIVARWYDLDVFYMNRGTRGVMYSGKLPMYSSVEDVLRKFELSGEVRFELKGRTLTVFDK